MSRILHILNGDCTAEVFRRADIADDHFVWRETLFEGPVAADLSGAMRQSRADYLDGIDQWVGGVRLLGNRNVWRWDEGRRQLQRK